MRLRVRVRPGASRTCVGGRYADALVVAVNAPAVDGRATEACLRALAEAFGVPRRAVRLCQGATARTKLVEIVGDDEAALGTRLQSLLDLAK